MLLLIMQPICNQEDDTDFPEFEKTCNKSLAICVEPAGIPTKIEYIYNRAHVNRTLKGPLKLFELWSCSN